MLFQKPLGFSYKMFEFDSWRGVWLSTRLMKEHKRRTGDEKDQLHTSQPQCNHENVDVIVIHWTNVPERDHNKQNN